MLRYTCLPDIRVKCFGVVTERSPAQPWAQLLKPNTERPQCRNIPCHNVLPEHDYQGTRRFRQQGRSVAQVSPQLAVDMVYNLTETQMSSAEAHEALTHDVVTSHLQVLANPIPQKIPH